MDTTKKVSFNTTMLTQSLYTTTNLMQDDNKLVKDIQNKIHQILKGGNADNEYSHRLKCKVPLLQTVDCQKLCNKLVKFNEHYKIDENDQNSITINNKVLKSYKFNSVISKRRLTKSQQQRNNSQINNSGHQRGDKYNKIFNTEWSEYQNIYDLHNLLSPNSLDMSPAYAEVEFIKSKIKKHHRDDIIISKSRWIKNNETKNYIDPDQVYCVQPNRISTSRVILKSNHNKESITYRKHQSFKN
ncbi:unnamed protein product (macronuclear) [Paramecium tetraurelia]|uniref:Uncharacterized protein n=1 Tax=Paramecium tetraurelia TaxID=5888 RepID=A0BZR1_PARTE|nr:uncharacterized protein GSPATT00005880001 [Paramecium tetraurelia]CAK64028.1 unnamed protein product [Paramecium tetraurelia]|eukprot:XP_001431426.1 hypothetical protein (macronuclear) [Paramecium tetraurelia strain d4-2]